ncbi:hypothetical protein LCGC14_3063360, partial [marine sediment metagenome]
FSFHLYLVIKKPDEVSMVSKEETFLFVYNDHITTYGHLATVQSLLTKHPTLKIGDRVKLYFPSHHSPAIEARFEDLDDFSNLICLYLDKSLFVPKRQTKPGKRIKLDQLRELNPDLAELSKDGIVYGSIENNELVSIAPIPFIIEMQQLSYAFMEGVWTKEDLRGNGYATGSVRSILNFLFTRKAIRTVFCWVDEKNEPAMKLFERIGFQAATAQEWVTTQGFVKDLR